jgi:hypothetical protein
MSDRREAIERELFNFRQMHASTDDRLALILLADIITDLEAEAASMPPINKRAE